MKESKMSKIDNQVIRNMQADDRAYGDRSDKKIVVQKDKSQKHRPQFNRMSVQDILNMEDDNDFDFEEELETN